jgi:hypothetical protein
MEARLAQLERSTHNPTCCSGHSQDNVDDQASQPQPREELKRKSMETETEIAAPVSKKQEPERDWHHDFQDDSSRIILQSNDGIHLCVDKVLLSEER